ncbi:MAG: tRNA-dihydrouridine synthase family protein [Patescibacteria group bacterium]
MTNIWLKLYKKNKPILALAPMAGWTDPAFRLICLENGADIIYTEMVSVEALWRKNKKTLDMLKTLPQEKNVILQLFGSKPESFKKALKIINFSSFSGIDINLGCPAHKVTKTGSGVALMDNKEIAREIIETTINNINLPVSIKIRSQVKNTSAIDFIKYIKNLNISAVMIHGRSLKQGFSGEINFEIIKNIKKLLPDIPVLANGGLNTPEDIKNILIKTNADGVGIARGAWGNPFIFDNIKKYIKNTTRPVPTLNKIKKTAVQHATYFLKYNQNLIPLRKQLLQYFKGQKNASKIRQKIIKIKDLDSLKNIKI